MSPGAASRSSSPQAALTEPAGPVRGTASWVGSIANLANTIVGAGVLAMPHAFASTGLFVGLMLIIACAFTSASGLYLLTRCAKRIEKGNASFFTVAKQTYPHAAIVFDLAIAVKCFGVAVSYLIVLGDLLPQIATTLVPSARDVLFLCDRRFYIAAVMVVITPMCFFRKLDSLKYVSVVALLAIAYLTIVVVAHYVIGDTLEERGPVRYIHPESSWALLTSLPVFVFAFTCHQNIFSIVNEIHDDSKRAINGVIFVAIGVAALVYSLVAVCGYLSFGDVVNSNIISMYAPSVSSTIGRCAIALLILFSYPLQCHPCRASLTKIVFADGTVGPHRFAYLTSLILLASFITAISVKSLDTMLAYVGATGSTSISFILPGVFYWKIIREERARDARKTADSEERSDNDASEETAFGPTDALLPQTGATAGASAVQSGEGGPETGSSPWSRKHTLLMNGALLLAVYGVLVMVVCLALNIIKSIKGNN